MCQKLFFKISKVRRMFEEKIKHEYSRNSQNYKISKKLEVGWKKRSEGPGEKSQWLTIFTRFRLYFRWLLAHGLRYIVIHVFVREGVPSGSWRPPRGALFRLEICFVFCWQVGRILYFFFHGNLYKTRFLSSSCSSWPFVKWSGVHLRPFIWKRESVER